MKLTVFTAQIDAICVNGFFKSLRVIFPEACFVFRAATNLEIPRSLLRGGSFAILLKSMLPREKEEHALFFIRVSSKPDQRLLSHPL